LWFFGGRKWLETDDDVSLVHGVSEPQMRVPRHPLYWRWRDKQWQERVLDQWLPLNPDAPVTHVTYWGAEAWCNWAGRRLPSEVEWEVAALGNRPGQLFQRYPWGNERAESSRVDMNGRSAARNPVGDFPAGDSPFG